MIIKNGTLVDPESGVYAKKDLVIEGQKIVRLDENINPNEYAGSELVDADGLTVAPGFVDVHTHFRDPGFTVKEDIHSGALAAAAGGYCSVVCMANTSPAIDNPAIYKEISKKMQAEAINLFQAATVTLGRAGRETVDFGGLKAAGVLLFTDDGSPITDETVIESAMRSAASLNAVLSFHEENPAFIGTSGVNSGKAADALGLKGADREAEISMVRRDLELALKYGCKIDIQHVSAAESVELIREAKKNDSRGLIHAEATPNHFSLTEDAVSEYGTLAKINPPLRTEKDRLAIIEGLSDGTIDLIATDHAPHTAAEKARDFADAPSGIIGLETAFSLGLKNLVLSGYLSITELVRLMSCNPARLLGLNAGSLAVGSQADIVLLSLDDETHYSSFKSRSSNTPYLDKTLPGRIAGTICRGSFVYRS